MYLLFSIYVMLGRCPFIEMQRKVSGVFSSDSCPWNKCFQWTIYPHLFFLVTTVNFLISHNSMTMVTRKARSNEAGWLKELKMLIKKSEYSLHLTNYMQINKQEFDFLIGYWKCTFRYTNLASFMCLLY